MNLEKNDLRNTLHYLYSELNRVQTIAGTLSTIEMQHYQDLTDIGNDKLNDMALEEQNASRQLGEVKQICIALAQKVNQLKENLPQTDAAR